MLLLTLDLDADSLAFFEAQRRRYFPSELNVVPAHLMLFHKLPGEEISFLRRELLREASACRTMTLRITGLRSLGRGVAYQVECAELILLHKRLAALFGAWLTPQDRQRYRPHITIQNKVSAEEAKLTLQFLQPEFVPFEAAGTGLALWRYLGGPWEFVERFPFNSDAGLIPPNCDTGTRM